MNATEVIALINQTPEFEGRYIQFSFSIDRFGKERCDATLKGYTPGIGFTEGDSVESVIRAMIEKLKPKPKPEVDSCAIDIPSEASTQ